MGSLESRVSKLEQGSRRRPAPSRTQLEIWAIDAELRRLERELKALGVDPSECWRGAPAGLPLDEHIAMLEAEIAQEEAGL
jgi:hypothetical protein